MRKNLLASVTSPGGTPAEAPARAAYAGRGASRSMMLSIEEMAENAKRLVSGEAIVSLDPGLVDGSFVSDRLEDDEADFALLREGIGRDGQLQPILVRPHPQAAGRYMVVFGHRRARAARELGVPVRAVVRDLEEIAHIIAQGQENSRRSDLSFIEKALFARKLLLMGQGRDTIKSALSVDDTLLSRMTSVLEIVPPAVIDALGPAKSIGRDRWEDLKKSLSGRGRARRALEAVASEGFAAMDAPARFAFLLAEVRRSGGGRRKPPPDARHGTWAAADKAVAATFRGTGKSYSLTLTSKDAGEFGRFVSASLEELYRAFKEARAPQPGD